MREGVKDSIIVSVDRVSIETAIKSKFYATKRNIDPKVKYIFFYQILPTSAITHYGEIEKLEVGGIKEVGKTYWLRNFPDSSPPFTIARLKDVKKLKRAIKRDTKIGIQSPIYASFAEVRECSKLSELI